MASGAVTREAVVQAIAEFDRLGREVFLDTYGFKRASGYLLLWDGREYDSKAVLAVAHGYMPGGQPLKWDQLSGGLNDAVRKLRALGFDILTPEDEPDWTWDEHVLALDLYMVNPSSPPAKGSAPILELSALLNRLGERSGIARSPKYRNPNGVYMKLMNFRRVDPAIQAQGKVGLSRGAKLELSVWDAYEGDPPRLRADAAAIRLAVEDEGVPLAADVYDYEAEEGAILLKLHRSRERDRKLVDKKKSQALAALGRLQCEVCDFDFGERYGSLGIGVIEAHHRKPVATLVKGERTKLADLALVCANCHRMLHKGRNPLGVEALRSLIKEVTPSH